MVFATLKRVYARPIYGVLTFRAAALTLSVLLLLPNQALLFSVLLSPVVSLVSKVAFVITLHGTLLTNFAWYAAIYTVLIAFLFGVNASLLWYYIKRSRGFKRANRSLTFTGFGGLTSGLLGIGCAACGTIIISAGLQLLGIGWLLSYLPLGGAEFGFIGVLLLLITAHSLIKRINDPLVC